MTLMQTLDTVPSPEAVSRAAEAAGRKIAPLWPLSSFVAVNPFLGLSDKGFDAAMAEIGKTAGAKMTLAPADYLAAIEAGRITRDDLDAALALHPEAAPDAEALIGRARAAEAVAPAPWPTLADLAGGDWPRRVEEMLAGLCAVEFDVGQAHWAAAPSDGLWARFRAEAAHDLSLAALGLDGAAGKLAAMPGDASAALVQMAVDLGLSEPALQPYFTRALNTLPGWAGHARYRLWQAELSGGTDAALGEVLAVRVALDWLLRDHAPAAGWEEAKAAYAEGALAPGAGETLMLALQAAYEAGWQRQAFAALAEAQAAPTTERPALQAAFCIDVRSEVFRRALEAAMPGVETIGFAGFFGAAVSYKPLGAAEETARCPVLLSPSGCAHEAGPEGLAETRAERIAAKSVWGRFKQAAVAGFGYVEAFGLVYAANLAAQSLKMTTALGRGHAGLTAEEAAGLAPSLDVIPEDARVDTAATILKAMSLTGPFARIVMLAGHGGQSLNNPHNAGLDCGACGGHDGEANARLVAALLNDAAVRAGLPGHGIAVPEDTVFVPALHDTTTDEVALFDLGALGAGHAEDLKALKAALARAGRIARSERAALLHLDPGARIDAAVADRARDWSQVRPEWALVGCAAFIAAPRQRTQGVDLGGRAFLHSYDWQADAEAGYPVLELILTAPLIVASWINLQYYGSSVAPDVYGAGNKVLHNVSGLVGVIEGSSGDLRPGLPWQSVHDGERLIHEPMRLNAVVEAPAEAMGAIIAKHDGLRELLDNGWIHLFRMDAEGQVVERYVPGGDWARVARPAQETVRKAA